MAPLEVDKENVAPPVFPDSTVRQSASPSPSPAKSGRKGRSKSIGPGALDEAVNISRNARDRRKSAFVPATKSILARNEDAEKAARRKTLVNRRVSFAPEATLHTWDVIEFARDQTSSTNSSESTRRNSHFTRSSTSNSDGEDAENDDEGVPYQRSSPAKQGPTDTSNRRRNSGASPASSDAEDPFSGVAGSSSDESGSDDEDDENSGDDSGTAMSLDVDEDTMRSAAESEGSTGSSARLEAALRQAAETAGTRGIEYDEYGEMSMEIVGDEITNAFKPWAQRNAADAMNSVDDDQENVNPFLSAFKAQGALTQPPATDETEDGDVSMDVTRAVGAITKTKPADLASSPFEEATMDFTRAVGKITGQKRRHSTTETGSPAAATPTMPSKRTRSSASRASAGDDAAEQTARTSHAQTNGSPLRAERRRSLRQRRSSGVASELSEATMEFTHVVGGIRGSQTVDSANVEDHEDLSMELTTVMGGIKSKRLSTHATSPGPVTPPTSTSPDRLMASRTPKDQERFKDTPDLSAKRLLTPLLKKQALQATGNSQSPKRSRPSSSPRRTPLREESTQDQVTGSPLPPGERTPEVTQRSVNKEANAAARTPELNLQRKSSDETSNDELTRQLNAQLQAPEPSPLADGSHHSSPVAGTPTPERRKAAGDTKTLADSIKLMSTPRKETLKNVSPQKQTPSKRDVPLKAMTPKSQRAPRGGRDLANTSPARKLRQDLENIPPTDGSADKIGLQEFLAKAGIRFMDLTTTKRRVTAAPTPSKPKDAGDSPNQPSGDDESAGMTLESSVVAAACTIPELDLYQHACHELKRYTREGKQTVAELEAETGKGTPPLIQAYMHASAERKTALDAQMRDIKTNARFRSKEMWYAWRSKLLDELMVGLQRIGEGLIKDNEPLEQAERVVDRLLPGLIERHAILQQEAERLRSTVSVLTDEEKEELQSARQTLRHANDQLREKRAVLEELRRQTREQDELAEHLEESQAECSAAIQEASRVRDACRGVSVEEIAALKESIKQLEDTFGWSITGASASAPSTVTMTYRSEVELCFAPGAFQHGRSPSSSSSDVHHDNPGSIRLHYIGGGGGGATPPSTTQRFFLQVLRAALHALPPAATRLGAVLSLVRHGWDTARAVAEAERRLGLAAPTRAVIRGDERLTLHATLLLPRVRSKVVVTFDLAVAVVPAPADDDRASPQLLSLHTAVRPDVAIVYGEKYNERNMTEFVKTQLEEHGGAGGAGTAMAGLQGWDVAFCAFRDKLVARGPKGGGRK